MSLGRNIRNARLVHGWTQEDLARRCDMPAMQISHYECERRAPTIDNLRKLCAALYVSADSLLALPPQPQPSERVDDAADGEEG